MKNVGAVAELSGRNGWPCWKKNSCALVAGISELSFKLNLQNCIVQLKTNFS